MHDALGKMHVVETGSNRMCFHVCGDRSDLPDLVLEHGNAGNAMHWAQLVPLLAAHGRVFSYDRAGSGGSSPDERGYAGAETTQRLSRLVEQAGVRKPFVLAGYSLGGLYARHYAASHPQDVLRLVLVDPTPAEWEDKAVLLWRARFLLLALHWAARTGLLAMWWKIAGKKATPELRRDLEQFKSPEHFSRIVEQMRASSTVRAEVARHAARIGHPVLSLIAGNRPGMPGPEANRLREMNRALVAAAPAGSRLVEIAQAHHGNILKEAAAVEQCAQHILDFLRDCSAPA